jgi:hypothetical protein
VRLWLYEGKEEGRKVKRAIGIIVILLLMTSLTSCIAVGSGGEKMTHQPTIGQQLIDLQKARDEGAITAKEYEELKDKIKKLTLVSAGEK